MKADYVHKDTLTATDYVELNKNNELLISYNQALLKENQELKKQLEETKTNYEQEKYIVDKQTRQLTDEYKNTENQTNKVDELKNQQKEFIEYLEDLLTIKKQKANTVRTYQRTVIPIQEILINFKKIIGDDK